LLVPGRGVSARAPSRTGSQAVVCAWRRVRPSPAVGRVRARASA
jgi:hypothetical protein